MPPRDVKGFPKVLVVADSAIGDSSGTGITLANVFANWPTDKIAQVHGRPLSAQRDFAAIPSLQVDKTRVPGYVLAAKLKGRNAGDGPPLVESEETGQASWLPSPRRRSRWQTAWLDLVPLKIRRDLTDFVTDFSPDVIVTLAGSVRVMRLAVLASRVADSPIVPHFMDDWISTLYRDSGATAVPRLCLELALRSMIRSSTRGMAISPAMAEEYSRKFDLPFVHMGNLVQSMEPRRDVPSTGSQLRLGYLGGLHLGRDATLLRLARAVEGLQGTSLTVIAPGNVDRGREPQWAALESTTLASPIPANEVVAGAAEFDVLVHVESFEADQRRFTRLSLSTKIAQYLSVGRPLLAIGPPEIASIKYIDTSGVGVVVARSDESEIHRALIRLRDTETRSRMAHHAMVRASEDFEVTKGTERLCAWLAGATDGPRASVSEVS